MVQCTKGSGSVFLGTSARCVSISVAVGALGGAFGRDDFLDLSAAPEEEDACDSFSNIVGVARDKHRSFFFLDSLVSQSL